MQRNTIKLGLFSDLHYALRPSSHSRYYDNALSKLEACYKVFREESVDFVVCLGDLIDHPDNPLAGQNELDELSSLIQSNEIDFHLVLGNHDTDTLSRKELYKRGNFRPFPYYAFTQGGIHFLILDSNYNCNDEPFPVGECIWDETYINQEQITWIQAELEQNKTLPIIVFVHANLDPFISDETLNPHVIKNASTIRAILEQHPKPVTVFQGHYHPGRTHQEKGITYYTLPGNVCFKDDFFCLIVQIDLDGTISITSKN